METTSTTKKPQNLKNGKVRLHLNIDVRKEMEDSRLNAIRQLIQLAYGMAVSHSFRRSGFLCFILSSLLLYRGITIGLGQPQMFPRLADHSDLVLRENSAASTNLNSITASWARRHIVSPILRKGFSSSRTSYYPNSVASYQIIRLQLSGDVNPNPGPNGSEQHNSTEQQNSTQGHPTEVFRKISVPQWTFSWLGN